MNCEKAHKWISLRLDGELSPDREARLEQHLAGCKECRNLAEEWSDLGQLVRETHPSPRQTPEASWMDIRRRIRLEGEYPREAGTANSPAFFGLPLRWAASVAALLLVAFMLYMLVPHSSNPTQLKAALAIPEGSIIPVVAQESTEVEFVETSMPDATPLVYEDEDTGLTVIWMMVDAEEEAEHAKS